jgi:hypothetical protein
MKQCPANILFDLRKLNWSFYYSLNNGIKLNEQFPAKSGTLVFIPNNRIQYIEGTFCAILLNSVYSWIRIRTDPIKHRTVTLSLA